MRIGLYGLPSSGKSYILSRIDFIDTLQGSNLLKSIAPDFHTLSDIEKDKTRKCLAESLYTKDSFIMDGHFSFGNNVVFTEEDGKLYDVIIYIFIKPEILEARLRNSEKNSRYTENDIKKWQEFEVNSLRDYCHKNNKDFYVVDNPGEEYCDEKNVVDFIRDIVNGFSCLKFAKECVERILQNSSSDAILLLDGDKTLTTQDTSNSVFGYTTHLYDGNFYTGYQAWLQNKEFEKYEIPQVYSIPVPLNEKVYKALTQDSYILTSGHEKIWCYIAKELGVGFFCGYEMSAETKFFITKFLQNTGRRITAYGDGMNDYYMLKQADKGYLVAKTDRSISRSLKNKDLGGIEIV